MTIPTSEMLSAGIPGDEPSCHVFAMKVLGGVVVAAPLAMVFVLGFASLIGRSFAERTVSRICQTAITLGLLASVAVLAMMLIFDDRHVPIVFGNWVEIGHGGPETDHSHYHFLVKFVFDRLSVPFVILTFVLCGTIGAFATRYMHREGGYNRFFVLYAVFVLGMVATSLAGTIETLFTGWELVGLSSALLVAFFQERPAPPRNGLRVWVVYRLSDAALLLAAVFMHHLTGEGDLSLLLGANPAHPWPEGETAITPNQTLLVGGLIVFAAAGKSALVPFSGWLPRAMEGPTPSSAVFYGALSVHLGAYLLLRVGPILKASDWLAWGVVALGLGTSLFAYHAGRVQTDVKSALSFASLVQVGLIVAEVGLGCYLPILWYVAIVHTLGHAFVRTLQFVRAPSALQDVRLLENAVGGSLPVPGGAVGPGSGTVRLWLYRFALERGFLDSFLDDCVVGPFVKAFRWCDGMERRWTDFLSGNASRETDLLTPQATDPARNGQTVEAR